MDWKTEMLKRLDALADKLGTTSAYLWHILVKQAYLSGFANLTFGVLFIAGIFVLVKVFKYAQLKSEDSYHNDGWVGMMFASFLGGVALSIVAPILIYSAILEIANPEYYALHEILQAVK